MSTCPHSYSLNPDISGIGVRVSFYLQTLFLGCLSARSGSLDEISGALYTLMATNTAMAVTGLILGLKPMPEISFQDALVMLYLLSMAWITVMASLASCNRLSEDTKILQLCSVIQGYVILTFALTVLGKAPSFGQSADCNPYAAAVIFRPFSALKSGRIFGWIVVGLACMIYTIMTARDYTTRVLKKIRESQRQVGREEAPPPVAQDGSVPIFTPPEKRQLPINTSGLRRQFTDYGTPRLLIHWPLVFTLLFITLFWAFFVLNTELVIRWNRPPSQATSGTNWQFGQILPLFLAFLPLINMINTFNRFGLKPTRLEYREVKVSVIYDAGFDARQR
ncbi:hypothetical protein DFH09DRAFT_1199344 [Mycena vulgaris]|nr:hypothetical protein DFH09DRAFT_1199344 [Mycena vulgaris]